MLVSITLPNSLGNTIDSNHSKGITHLWPADTPRQVSPPVAMATTTPTAIPPRASPTSSTMRRFRRRVRTRRRLRATRGPAPTPTSSWVASIGLASSLTTSMTVSIPRSDRPPFPACTAGLHSPAAIIRVGFYLTWFGVHVFCLASGSSCFLSLCGRFFNWRTISGPKSKIKIPYLENF